MDAIEAPDGYEAVVFFDDAIREYRVAVRRVGASWWKNVGYAGHAHLTRAERDERARKAVLEAVAARLCE